MKKLKLTKVIASTLVVASVLALNPIGASAEWERGSKPINQEGIHGNRPAYWYKEGDSWATGWKQIEGDWYYFEPSTGYTVNGWKYMNGNWYCFDGFRGKMYQGTIFLNKSKGQGYYLNSDGVYIENPPVEVEAYINLLLNENQLKNLNIISSDKRLIGWMGMGSSLDKPVYDTDEVTNIIISDINHDGILEMSTSSKLYGIKSIVKYINGSIIVDNGKFSTNNPGTTKNIVEESGLHFDTISGRLIAYRKDNGSDFVIPDTINGTKVNTITSYAFMTCGAYNLKTLTIPETVTNIENHAFEFDDDLTIYVYSDRVKQLVINSGVKESQVIIRK